jgi:hypothetical protein
MSTPKGRFAKKAARHLAGSIWRHSAPGPMVRPKAPTPLHRPNLSVCFSSGSAHGINDAGVRIALPTAATTRGGHAARAVRHAAGGAGERKNGHADQEQSASAAQSME